MTYDMVSLKVGLAVDDIKGVQEAAVLKRLALQVGTPSPQTHTHTL